jgi:hypothetical protein
VYVCPRTDVETLNAASKILPVLSITQKGDEARPVGFDEIMHAPASNVENGVAGVPSVTGVPAGPLPGVIDVMTVGAAATVKAAGVGKGPAGVVASTTLMRPV